MSLSSDLLKNHNNNMQIKQFSPFLNNFSKCIYKRVVWQVWFRDTSSV